MSRRTDAHRPGAIIPQDYEALAFFSFGGSDGCPPLGVDYMLKLRAELGSELIDREGGGCNVCGAHYRHGVIFKYLPSGKTVTMGHECAAKYEMLADFAAYDAAFEAHQRANAATITRVKNQRRRERFLDKHEGLAEALQVDHRISRDLASQFETRCKLSDAQVALAFKLLADLWKPVWQRNETNVSAPEGRVTVRGTVVSAKWHEGQFGTSLKITVKVQTDLGCWLAWGSAASNMLEFSEPVRDVPSMLRGAEVEFTASVQRGREPHFAFFKRPTGARVVTEGPAYTALREERMRHLSALALDRGVALWVGQMAGLVSV